MKKSILVALVLAVFGSSLLSASVHTEYKAGYGYNMQTQKFRLPTGKVEVKESLQTAFAGFNLYFDDDKTFGLGFEYMNDYPGLLAKYGASEAKTRGFTNTVGLAFIYNKDLAGFLALHTSLGFGTSFRNSSAGMYIPSYGGYTDYGEIDLKITGDAALSLDIASRVYINAGIKAGMMFLKYLNPSEKNGSYSLKGSTVRLDEAFGYEFMPYVSLSLVF